MMPATRLIERLNIAVDEQDEKDPDKWLLESIRLHMVRLLSTRKGTVMLDPNFGLPDLNEASNVVAENEQWSQQILTYIVEAEPRLTNIEMEFGAYNSEFGYNALTICGFVNLSNERVKVVMTAHVFDQGNVEIKPIDVLR